MGCTDTITIEELLKITGYGVHINIKLADTGAIAINGVSSLENSKDVRQKVKWDAFKTKPVFSITPAVETASLKPSFNQMFRVIIWAYILRSEYDKAIAEYNAMR